jgi:hypothetical protein
MKITRDVRNLSERNETIMATCSITDPFVVKASDFYRAIAKAEKDAEERKKRPAPPKVHVTKMTDEEADRMMGFAK